MKVDIPELSVTCLLVTFIALLAAPASAYMLKPEGYQSDQSPIVYKMPKRHSNKFKVFAECRRDCAGKCNHSLYAYLTNKNECFTCLMECMSVFTEQAEKMGIRVDSDKTKKRARRVTDYSMLPNLDKKTVPQRSNYPLRGYARSQKK